MQDLKALPGVVHKMFQVRQKGPTATFAATRKAPPTLKTIQGA